ncbi:MAG: hypothetical protein ACRCV6_08915 [Formosimonas sp.]
MKWRAGFVATALSLSAWAQSPARVHTDLASRYFQVGQVATAVDEAQIALKYEANDVPAHTILALIYAQLQQNDLADAHFARALSSAVAQNQSTTDVRNSYAWYLCQTERGEQALSEFAQVLRDPLYGSLDKALLNAGACAARLKRLDLAMPYLDAALDAKPNNGAAYIYRAHAWLQQGRIEAARVDWRNAQTLRGGTPELLWLQARLERAQQLPQWLQTLQQLQREFSTSAQANWARAELYETF